MAFDLQSYLAKMVAMQRRANPREFGAGYVSAEEFVLLNGDAPSVNEPLSPEERRIVEAAASCLELPRRQCFANSQLAVLGDHSGTLRYVEGFLSFLIPIHHGWVEINGKAVDLTIRLRESERAEVPAEALVLGDRMAGAIPPGFAFFGVSFTRAEVSERVAATGEVGAFLDWSQRRALEKTLARTPRYPARRSLVLQRSAGSLGR